MLVYKRILKAFFDRAKAMKEVIIVEIIRTRPMLVVVIEGALSLMTW